MTEYHDERIALLNTCILSYEYEGTWIAANLKITLPTPETHPEFPLWMMGYTPQEVYETFWPPGFQYVD